MIASFAKAGGKIYVCSSCFKQRGLAENNLVEEATVVPGGKLIEFMSGGAPCITRCSEEGMSRAWSVADSGMDRWNYPGYDSSPEMVFSRPFPIWSPAAMGTLLN